MKRCVLRKPRWDFFDFFFLCTIFITALICRPADSIVSEDAGIEPRTVATTALTVRRSYHAARSHPKKFYFYVLLVQTWTKNPKVWNMIQINISDIEQIFANFSRNFSSVETLLHVLLRQARFYLRNDDRRNIWPQSRRNLAKPESVSLNISNWSRLKMSEHPQHQTGFINLFSEIMIPTYGMGPQQGSPNGVYKGTGKL